MIKYDCHMHTNFSSDSQSLPESMAEAAISLGLSGICITDHMDLQYPAPEGSDWDFVFNPDEYLEMLESLKGKYKGRLDILYGVEFGLRNERDIRDEIREECIRLAAEYPFDFIIGSTHVAEKTDPYYPIYWERGEKKQRIGDFFTAIYENSMYYEGYDTCAHLDYIVRYTPDRNPEYSVSDYSDILDMILKKLIESGKALECNSSGFKYGLSRPHPKTEVLRRYRELGGELLTIGSDAHKPEHIAYDFIKTEELLKETGFKYYTVFRKRKPEFIRLS